MRTMKEMRLKTEKWRKKKVKPLKMGRHIKKGEIVPKVVKTGW
jgi:hypothetical protein